MVKLGTVTKRVTKAVAKKPVMKTKALPKAIEVAVVVDDNPALSTYILDTVLPSLALVDDAGEVINEVTRDSVYSIKDYSKDNGDDVQFISMRGTFTNEAEYVLYVTIVVINDSRYYMTLGNEEIRARLGRDQFVNNYDTMRTILANMKGSAMSEEDIAEELSSIDSFGL